MMSNDFEVGRVVAVDTSQVTIELNRDLKALTRSTYEQTVEVGRINSYVIIPVGVQRIVAMITKVVLTEEAELKTDKTMVTLPSARRLMKATMIGTIDGDDFKQGIGLFPVLDSPVLVASQKDLQAIFGTTDQEPNEDNPGYCISIGKSAIFPEYDVCINPDSFFGKHAAIIGSTGSGKSCTIATIIQSILENKYIKGTCIIILDTNGEYRNAFQKLEGNKWLDAKPEYRTLYIPTDPGQVSERLCIPYWFMNADEFARIFQAAPQIQRPVLFDALRLAKMPDIPDGEIDLARNVILQELYRIVGYAQRVRGVSTDIRNLSDGLINSLNNDEIIRAGISNELADRLIIDLQEITNEMRKYIGNNDFPRDLPLPSRRLIESKLNPYIQELVSTTSANPQVSAITADSPTYFSKNRFLNIDLENAMHADETGAARARENCATMLMRINRLFNDKRYEFLFGPVVVELPKPLHSLATFLRDILGLIPSGKELSSENEVSTNVFPFYDRQRKGFSKCYKVVIVDLSLLCYEILENITALIGRLVLEFLQRAGDEKISGIKRGAFPVVMVLEEAQNYIRERSNRDDDSISREVFERIAREGRKYGLSLVIASQRPSEISKTILSQCSSFIVHRLQNPEDLRYFREIVPGAYNQLLDQLPALAPRHALVLGESVRAPALVYMKEANPVPQSKDPEFYAQWVREEPIIPDVEKVCELWEKGISEAAPTEDTAESVELNISFSRRESAANEE